MKEIIDGLELDWVLINEYMHCDDNKEYKLGMYNNIPIVYKRNFDDVFVASTVSYTNDTYRIEVDCRYMEMLEGCRYMTAMFILGHEIGHIECEHLTGKCNKDDLTRESEADAYGRDITGITKGGLRRAFKLLNKYIVKAIAEKDEEECLAYMNERLSIVSA